MPGHTSTAVIAGIITAVVGFTSSFAVVLTGLRAVGASDQQAASALLVVCVTQGLGSIAFSWKFRMPITMAWSTPGAALLATAAIPAGGFPAAIGAFALAGVLIAACGFIRPLGTLVAAIPPAIANAMLAGVLLVLCVEPFRSLVASPAAVAPVLVVWLVMMRLAPRWAVPAGFVAALVVMAVSGSFRRLGHFQLTPIVTVNAPGWHPVALVAIGLPLFLVTMTGQNIPGMAVLASFGYRPPIKPLLVYTGLGTMAGASFGAHSINLAAISAALSAGPSAGPDPARRWIAGVSTGVSYLILAPLSALVAAVSAVAPGGVIAAVAGVALIGAFASAAGSALADAPHRAAAAVTFLIAASGIAVAGIGSAFWGLLGGAAYLGVTRLPLPSWLDQRATAKPAGPIGSPPGETAESADRSPGRLRSGPP